MVSAADSVELMIQDRACPGRAMAAENGRIL